MSLGRFDLFTSEIKRETKLVLIVLLCKLKLVVDPTGCAINICCHDPSGQYVVGGGGGVIITLNKPLTLTVKRVSLLSVSVGC